MGIFDFLKIISGKLNFGKAKMSPAEQVQLGKQEKREVKAIKLEKAGELVDSFYENLAKDTNLKLVRIRERLVQEKTNMEKNIEELEEAKPKNQAFPERAMHLMEGNKKSYVQKLKVLLRDINLPDEFDETLRFADRFEVILDDFSKNTVRNYQILQQFFGEKTSSISKNIVNINELVKQAGNLVKYSGIEKVNELKNKIKNVHEKIKRKEEIKEKIKLGREEQQEINKKLTEKEIKIKETEEGDRYRHFTELINKKRGIEREIVELERQPLYYFSAINDALKKYERLTLDDKLVKRYLDAPLKALEEDKELRIVEIVSKMKRTIINGGLELKKERKDRILQGCDKVDKNYFASFLSKYNELNKKLAELNSQIANEIIVKEIESLREELRKEKSKANENNNKIEKMAKELEMIDIDSLKREVELKIIESINEKVRIIS